MAPSLRPRSSKIISAALDEFGGERKSAAVVLFFAIAEELGKISDANTAAEYAYLIADQLATEGLK